MSNYGAIRGDDEDDGPGTSFHKEKRCNDCFFGILFIAHMVVIMGSLLQYGKPTEEEIDNVEQYATYGVIKFVGIACVTAIALSTISLSFMAIFTDILVETALCAVCILTLAVAIYGIYVWQIWLMCIGGISFLLSFIYTCCVWNRIEFAAANLRTALKAIRTNFGLIIMSYIWEIVAFMWALLWLNATRDGMSSIGVGMLFLYLLSFFWTQQVINNIQQVMVASVIGAWWYTPERADQCWDDALNSALCSVLTYNFGSICFGSLFASTVQAMEWTLRLTKTNDHLKWITRCIQCCLHCIQDAIEYFNKWAFTFVGIHGDSFIGSGKRVIRLFKQRGWVNIITDSLAETVMFFMKIAIALLTGLTGWYLTKHDADIFASVGDIAQENDEIFGFILASIIGFMFASIMMELVSSAVYAVIVCFAESPTIFQQNYPQLCTEMLDAWKAAYPDETADDFNNVV